MAHEIDPRKWTKYKPKIKPMLLYTIFTRLKKLEEHTTINCLREESLSSYFFFFFQSSIVMALVRGAT